MSPLGDLLKDGVAFAVACFARMRAVGTVKASEEGSLWGNGLTEGSNVSVEAIWVYWEVSQMIWEAGLVVREVARVGWVIWKPNC